MPIRFRCQDCRSRVKVPEGTQGKQVKCPRCGRIQSVPRHHSQGQQDAEPLTVHTLVGSMHQSPKRKEALVGSGSNGYNHYESRGGGAPGGLDIPEEAAESGYTNHKHDRMSRKQRRRMEARAREAELARQAAAKREAETLDQDAINESRKRVADLFATSESKSFDEAETESAPISPLVAETARAATPPKAIAFAGNGSTTRHEEPAAAVTASAATKPSHVVESAAQQDSVDRDDASDTSEPDARWTFDMTSDAYPFLKVIPWVLRITALMLIGPAFKVMLVADAQGFSGVVSLLVLFMGLALVVVTWTVGEIATAVRDIALKKATG